MAFLATLGDAAATFNERELDFHSTAGSVHRRHRGGINGTDNRHGDVGRGRTGYSLRGADEFHLRPRSGGNAPHGSIGPLPWRDRVGAVGSGVGLVVHFALMAIMAACFVYAARNWPALVAKPIHAGIAYGLITYVVMNWVVVPIRFDSPLPPQTRAIVSQLFAHIALVGLPIALIAAKNLRGRLIA